MNLSRNQSSSFFSSTFVDLFVCLFVINTSYFEYLQSIRTRRLIKTRKVQIREIWINIRSRNRYRFAVFVFVWFWDIDRFIILICRYFRDQNFQQSFHFRFAYIFCFRFRIFCFRIYFFTFIAFVLKLSTSIMIKQIFESSLMIFLQCRSIRKKNSRFETKLEKKKKIMLRTCLKISIEILFYQRKFSSN